MRRRWLSWFLPALCAGALAGWAGGIQSLLPPPALGGSGGDARPRPRPYGAPFTPSPLHPLTPSSPGGAEARIHPDYAGITLPPNIAPLNFRVEEPGDRCRVRATAGGKTLDVESRSMSVAFPERAWRDLLQAARGGDLTLDISVRREGAWHRYAPIRNRVASEEIDRYLTYRLIKPLYNLWKEVGVYQRDLTGFRERPVLQGKRFGDACLNCHSFRAGHTDTMAIGTRGEVHGSATLVYREGRTAKLDAKWGYTSWHPEGRFAAYSLNKVRQFFHSAGEEPRDVVDLDSDVVVQEFPSLKVTAAPAFADPDRLETYPAWSHDGRALYFCSAPFPWTRRDRMPPENYDQVRYDLARARFDPKTGAWGKRETLLSGEATGKSLMLPRPSPDGRWLLFCMCRYGCFPVYQPSSDLYLMDLKTGAYRRLDILNSERSESWHSWSTNSRWIAYSTKRDTGLFTRTYIAYVDGEGQAHKPFILPQRDPGFYDSYLNTFTVPELTVEPVAVSNRALAATARSSNPVPVQMPGVSMTRKPVTPKESQEDTPWHSGHGR